MSDQQIDRIKLQSVERLSELNKRKTALEKQLRDWGTLFGNVSSSLQSLYNNTLTDAELERLPAGTDVRSALAELRDVSSDLQKTKKEVVDLGLNL